MKNKGLSVAVGIYLFMLTVNAGAAPIRPVGPIDVTGTISGIQWVPETSVKGKPGWSGSLGHDRIRPANFLLTLTDYEGVNDETAYRMTRYLEWNAFKDNEQKGKPPFVLLKINHNDKNYLRKGMRIRVTGYTVRGDEGGTWTYYAGVYDVDHLVTEERIRIYLEKNIESPGFGGRMFCAYEIFGTEKKGDRDYSYLWTLCMEYYAKGNSLIKGTGVSMPVVLISLRSSRGSDIVEHEKPVDGEGYAESIRRIFPAKYHGAILAGAEGNDRRAASLMRDTEKQASTYFQTR